MCVEIKRTQRRNVGKSLAILVGILDSRSIHGEKLVLTSEDNKAMDNRVKAMEPWQRE